MRRPGPAGQGRPSPFMKWRGIRPFCSLTPTGLPACFSDNISPFFTLLRRCFLLILGVMMSEKALRDLNAIPESEQTNANSINGCLKKPCTGNAGENFEEWKKKNSTAVSPPTNGENLNSVLDSVTSEIEYIESEKLNDVEDVNGIVKTLIAGLDSKEWVLVCEALNNVRRLSIFHKEAMLNILGDVVLFVVKSMKNPRSALCKTALMTSADIFVAYRDGMIESLDPLLVQLLLKSSQDKRFVCEAAETALGAMITSLSPVLLLPKLELYLKNRNPRIRAKAAMFFSRSALQLGVEGIREFGIDKLVQTASSQLSDQLPESREAARILLLELQTVYEKSHNLSPIIAEETKNDSWEDFCISNLSPLKAQAVLRVTNLARDSLVPVS